MALRLRRLRRYFLVGLVVVVPLAITALVLVWAFRAIDGILGRPLRLYAGVGAPGVGAALLLLLVLLVGWAVHQSLGRRLVDAGNAALSRFPVAGRVYDAGSQIIQAVLGAGQRIFLRAVLVPYPGPESWAVGLVTDEEATLFSTVAGEPCLCVFLPTTFSVPPSGYLLIVPASRTRPLPISVEDALKFVVSGGRLQPGATGEPARARGIDLAKLLD
jgi:uncharacterized membrane protein